MRWNASADLTGWLVLHFTFESALVPLNNNSPGSIGVKPRVGGLIVGLEISCVSVVYFSKNHIFLTSCVAKLVHSPPTRIALRSCR
jgi:hypothetical protein